MRSVPITDDLFTWPSETPRLIGNRCGACSTLSFPVASGCPKCGSSELTTEMLERDGTLWSWTTQEFPKAPYLGAASPETFKPWAVGLVELGHEVRVEGRLVDTAIDGLTIGQPMRTVVFPLAQNDEGRDVLMFGFAPATDPEGTSDD